MKLQALSIASLLALGAGCVGGTASTGNPSGETTADIQVNTSLAKRRDHHPIKSPLERITAPARKAARVVGAPAPALPNATAAGVQANLTYRNGPMLDSVEVYAVMWGTSVNPQVVSGVPGFFGGVTGAASPINSMLAQYNVTMPTPQTIGTGTFAGSIADDDAPMPSSGVITDAMIEAEGARLVDTGKVPAENGHNILMFFFPPGVAIDQGGGTMSCQVFCAYHSSFTRNGNNFFYGVIPDQNSGGCEQGCGLTTDPVKTTFSTSSHELIEAMTDAAVGAGSLAWYDDNYGEIGDVCIDWDGMSNNYYVQSEWSNADKGCVDHSATTNSSIDVSYDDSVVAAGGTATFNVTSSGNASGQLTLEAKELFTGTGGFTPTFSPATINVGGSSTLSVAVPAGLRSQDVSFKVAATDSNGTHHFAQVTMHIKGASPTITSATPATGPSQGGNVVQIVGTNFGPGATAKICASSSTTCPTTSTATIPAQGQYVSGSNGTKFQVIMPSDSVSATTGTKSVKIWITNPNDPTPAKVSYKYTTGAAPTVTGISPAQGPIAGNTFVTITGTNFSSNSTLTIAGQALVAGQTFLVEDDKTIIALTPAVQAAGMQTITVGNYDNLTGSLTNGFNYGPNVPPSIDALSVDTGPTAGGTYVTVFASNLDPNATVTFDGAAAMVKTVSDGFLGVFSPPHAAGAVDLVVTNSDGLTAKSTFTYSDATGGGGDDGGAGGDGTGGGGSGGTGGGNGNNPSNGISGNNHIDNSSGCSMGGDGGSAPSVVSLLVVLAAFGFALRRQRS